MSHIRFPLPRRGGSQWYRDQRDLSAFTRTMCGAPITDRDVNWNYGRTKKFAAFGGACPSCLNAVRAQMGQS